MLNFVVIAEPRCGFQYLSSILNQDKTLFNAGEILKPDKLIRTKNIIDHNIRTILKGEDAILYIEKEVQQYIVKENFSRFSLKIDCSTDMPKSSETIWDYIEDENIKIVHLKRRNLLNRLLSEKLALKEDNWFTDPYSSKVRITLDELQQNIAKIKAVELEVRYKCPRNPFFETYFEDYLVGKQEFTRLKNFLNVNIKTLQPTTIQQRLKGQAYHIKNYRSLYSQCLKDKKYFKWLEEIPMLSYFT